MFVGISSNLENKEARDSNIWDFAITIAIRRHIFDFDINQIAIILHHCIAFLGIVLWLKEPHH